MESYNPATGQFTAWVRIPVLSHSADTVLYLNYGNGGVTVSQENRAGVWDSSYNRPWRWEYVNGNDTAHDYADGQGFSSTVSYALKGLCGEFLTDMNGNEYFPLGGTGYSPPDYANNWPTGIPKGGSNPSAVWTDTIGLKDCIFGVNGCYPDSYPPQNPQLTSSIRRVPQYWFMGSTSNGAGARVQTDVIQLFQDHARHISVVSPNP